MDDIKNKLDGGLPHVDPNDMLNNVLNTAYGVAAIEAIVFIVVAGFQMVTSSGDSAKVAKARRTMVYAIVGLLLVLLAFAITNFVLKNV